MLQAAFPTQCVVIVYFVDRAVWAAFVKAEFTTYYSTRIMLHRIKRPFRRVQSPPSEFEILVVGISKLEDKASVVASYT